MTQSETFEGEEFSQLNQKEAKFVSILLKNISFSSVCRECGISRRTGYRYLARPAVKAAYKAALDQAVSVSQSQLSQLHETSVDVLAGILVNEEAPLPLRGRVAMFIVEVSRPMVELREMGEKVDELMAAAAQNGVYIKNGRKRPTFLSGIKAKTSTNGSNPGPWRSDL